MKLQEETIQQAHWLIAMVMDQSLQRSDVTLSDSNVTMLLQATFIGVTHFT